jgi:hypothetical protein
MEHYTNIYLQTTTVLIFTKQFAHVPQAIYFLLCPILKRTRAVTGDSEARLIKYWTQ